MGGDLTITFAGTDKLLESMTTVGEQAGELETYWQDHVCSTAGFDYPACAIAPIGDAVKKLGPAFSDMKSVFDSHWEGTADAIIASVKAIDETDRSVSLDYSKYLGQQGVPGTEVLPDVTVDVKVFDVDPLTLEAPGEGEAGPGHDPEWTSVSEGYDALRDTINAAVDKINTISPQAIPKVPEESLEHYIVYPLSGDYLAIQGNAAACDTTGQQMGAWGGNFSKFYANLELAMVGQTSEALKLHLNVYNLVMKAVGQCIDAGSTVFSKIAEVSEKIAIAVEKALVRMGKILLRVSTKVASRVLSWFGWVLLARDIVEKGFDAVTDIYDDVMRAKEIVETCFALVDEIKAWAEQAAEQIETLEKLRDIVEELPGSSTGGLEQLPPVDVSVTGKTLDEITFGNADEADTTDELDDSLDDLDASSEDAEDQSDGAADSDDDGDMLMAPGPLEGTLTEPGYSGSGTGMTA